MNYDEAKNKYKLDQVQGWMDRCDMEWLFQKASTMKNQKIVEIGCWKGKSTGAILSALQEGNVMYCVDVWDENITRDEEYKNSESAFDIFQNHTSKFPVKPNIVRKVSLEAVKDFENDSLDWVFIDGDHSVSSVLADIKEWSKKLKTGGILSGHDWQFDTVKEAIRLSGIKINGFTTHKESNGNIYGSIWWSEC